MSNLGLLLKVDIVNTFGINKIIQGDRSEKIKYGSIVVSLCVAFIVVAIGLYQMCLDISDILMQINQMELLLLAGFAGISGLCLFNTIYKAPSYLYQSRDYEMLSSLPIKDSTVLMSKMIKLMFSNYLYSFMLLVVPGLVYYSKMDVSAIFLVYLFIMCVVTPFIPIVLASAIAYVLGKVSARSKYKNAVLIIESIAMILIVSYASYNMDGIVSSVVKNSKSIIEIGEKIYPLTHYYLDALGNTNVVSMGVFVGVSVSVMVAFIVVFAKGFNKINNEMGENYNESNYEVKVLESSAPTKALLKKEIKRYLSSPIYVLNTSVGMILLIVLSLGIITIGKDKIAQMMEISAQTDIFNIQITGMMLFCILLSCTTNSSISLEGKNIWILKTSPVEELDILKSKIKLNLLLIIPIALISLIAIGIKLNFDFKFIVLMIVVIVECALLTSLSGLYINLLYPKLDYISDVEVVKRSMSSMVSIFSGMGYIGIYAAVYYFAKLDFLNLVMIGVVVTGILDIILWRLIKTKGVQLFKELC